MYFFREEPLPKSYCLRIRYVVLWCNSFSEELFCWRTILFKIKIATEEQSWYFSKQELYAGSNFSEQLIFQQNSFKRSTVTEEQLFGKNQFFVKAMFCSICFFRVTTFSKGLTFKKSYFFTTHFARWGIFLELYFLLKCAKLLKFIIFNPWNVPWNWIALYWNCFVMPPGLMRSTLEALQTRPICQNLLILQGSYNFLQEFLFRKIVFFRKARVLQLTSSAQSCAPITKSLLLIPWSGFLQ